MKRYSIPTFVLAALVIVLIVSACGTRGEPAVPTANPVDQAVSVQGTMLAAASTYIAETQTAAPTSTLPPTATITNTPAFTATLPIMPTLGATFTPSPSGNTAANDPCLTTVLPASLEGEKIKIRIDNPTKATLNVSVNLQPARAGALCGYRGYALTAGQSLVINDLVIGCYSIWAWNPDPKDYFMVTNGTSCLDTTNTWAFDISKNDIKLRP